MENKFFVLAVLVLLSSSFSFGVYLITDYFMDNDWPKTFAQRCDERVMDDCAFINSHFNMFGLTDYSSDISCTMMLDAGKQGGAKYKLTWKRFDLETSPNCAADFLALYDGHMDNVTTLTPYGSFCGDNFPNVTGFPTQRYVTLKFKTNGANNAKGFKLMATRTVPYPCPDGGDYFHCKSEDICIDKRLHCDGTTQCGDGTDEDHCSAGDRFIGCVVSLGLSTLMAIIVLAVLVSIVLAVIISMFTCCRKQCECCFSGCRRLRAAISSRLGPVCGRCWHPISARCWDPMCSVLRASVWNPIAARCARGKWSSKVCTVATDDVLVEAICKKDDLDEQNEEQVQEKDNGQSDGETKKHVEEVVVNTAVNDAVQEQKPVAEPEEKKEPLAEKVDDEDFDLGQSQGQQEVVVDGKDAEDDQEKTQEQSEGQEQDQNQEKIEEVKADATATEEHKEEKKEQSQENDQ